MKPSQWKALRLTAKDLAGMGVYAVEKDEYGELVNTTITTLKALKSQIKAYRAQGFKVYYNAK